MTEITDHLMKQLHFISTASNAFLNQRKQKLTGQQRVLAILNKEDGLIQSQLAEILDIRPSSLAESLKKMETNGDVYREEDTEDKRIKRVYLTEQGREKIAPFDFMENRSEAFFAGLDEEEREQFGEYMEKIAAGWSDSFRQQSARFVDPMDRLQAIQEMRQHFEEQFGEGMANLSPDELRKLRRKMKEEMRGIRPPFGSRRLNDEGPGWSFKKEFREGFWENPASPGKKEADENEDEWEDF